jgi:SNF2 family DNA or RNA helicase
VNLTAAARIIFVHPFLGSAEEVRTMERQFIGRVLRPSQTKDVEILRFIVQDTVESRM